MVSGHGFENHLAIQSEGQSTSLSSPGDVSFCLSMEARDRLGLREVLSPRGSKFKFSLAATAACHLEAARSSNESRGSGSPARSLSRERSTRASASVLWVPPLSPP